MRGISPPFLHVPATKSTSMSIPPDPYRDILGIDFTPERLEENLAAFDDIRREIEKLRRLDLTDVHPAIVFEPTAPYRKGGGK